MPNIIERVEDAGVPIRLHKLIYKFQEDVEMLVHDVKLREEVNRGSGMLAEILGEASVLQLFTVQTGGKKGNKKAAK